MVEPNSNPSPPKTALITGASQRIGAAIARSLAEQKTDLVIHHFDSEEEANELCCELQKYGGKAVPVKADLTKADEARQLFAASTAAIGPIELLVNNSSIFEPDTLAEPNDGLWADHFEIHLRSPSILAGQMAEQSGLNNGLIINMIDQKVRNLDPSYYSYTLSKSALGTATQTMAQSLGPKIRVNGIGPGPTLPNKHQSREEFEKESSSLLLGKGPDLDEFGETIKWLWNAKSVTGQLILLDGGQHLSWLTS